MSRTCACAVLLLSLLAVKSRAALAGPPADAELNARARAILGYFQQLQASPELKLVTGQFSGWSGEGGIGELAKIERATGHWPAVIGVDYCLWIKSDPDIETHRPNQLAIDYWHDGGLVTVSWHCPNPANPNGGGLHDKGVKIADLLVPGTPTYTRWLASLDRVAAGLQELQAAGVVVLWRPFHEMNGNWFWWGAQDPQDFIKAWRQMFDYFTKTKALHNLIWVYGPNQGLHTGDYYPGDNYTDIVGLDAYTDFVEPARVKGYPELARLTKPFGFAEFGPHGASDPPGDYDYRLFPEAVAKNFPATRFFYCWDKKWNPAENHFARELYADPRLVTRETLPAGLAGEATAKP